MAFQSVSPADNQPSLACLIPVRSAISHFRIVTLPCQNWLKCIFGPWRRSLTGDENRVTCAGTPCHAFLKDTAGRRIHQPGPGASCWRRSPRNIVVLFGALPYHLLPEHRQRGADQQWCDLYDRVSPETDGDGLRLAQTGGFRTGAGQSALSFPPLDAILRSCRRLLAGLREGESPSCTDTDHRGLWQVGLDLDKECSYGNLFWRGNL